MDKRPIGKALIALTAGAAEGVLFVWLPAYASGMFDEHTAMLLLLAIYCPFVVVPFLAITTWRLKPETWNQRLWVPALLTTAFTLISSYALASRDTKIHFSQFSETFWFVVVWLGCELIVLVVPASVLLTGIEQTGSRMGLSFFVANCAAASVFFAVLFLDLDISFMVFIAISALASGLANWLAYRSTRRTLRNT